VKNLSSTACTHNVTDLDYFIHASPTLSVHVARLISSLFSHVVVVNNMKVSTIKPDPKNTLNVHDSNNYCSIAIGSVLGKTVDLYC
jgi:hypothetical protein